MKTRDKIEKYILGQLSKEENAEFEKELETNSELKAQLEIDHLIVMNIQERAFVDEQIDMAKQHKGKARNIRLLIYPLLIAASLLLVVYISGIWQQPKYNKLYATAYESYDNDYMVSDLSHYRGSITLDTISILAMHAYENKNYEEAGMLLETKLHNIENPELEFFLAMSHLENNKTRQAIQIFEQLYSLAPDYRYYEQTRWYLALAYLKFRQDEKTIEYLNELIDLDGKYWDEAKELLQEI